ncbi:MAG: ATPase [Actinomycetota bacterium]|nr:ATPase [Actinomycetota bacterium]MDQ2957747.1 ATPase [Actinomycetota bacterium]
MPTTTQLPRLHVVTGKGGTGKTTVAGALALALAANSARVLLVEVEGRQGLAQLFDTPPLPYAETRLAATSGGEVIGLAVDAEAAMLEYLEMFYNIKRGGSVLRKMGAIDFVTTIAPGLRDVLLTGKVKEAVTRTRGGRPDFDAVVLDAPPTGRVVQFLQATHEVAGLTKIGPIHRQSTGVIDLLHSARTHIHLVTLLEEMPVQETLDAAGQLREHGYQVGQVIVNRARPVLVSGRRPNQKLLAEGLGAAGLDPSIAGALVTEVLDYAARQDVQVRASEELDQLAAPVRRLPELAPPMDLSNLFELAEALDVKQWSV